MFLGLTCLTISISLYLNRSRTWDSAPFTFFNHSLTTHKKLPVPFIKKKNRWELVKSPFFFTYLPEAKDFSTPMMDAGIAMATNAKAKLGSSSMRHSDLI